MDLATLAVVDHVLFRRLELVCCDLDELLADLLGASHESAPAHGGASAAVGPHAEGHPPRVPVDDLDVLHRDPELVGDDLREGGLVPLTVGVRSGEDA